MSSKDYIHRQYEHIKRIARVRGISLDEASQIWVTRYAAEYAKRYARKVTS